MKWEKATNEHLVYALALILAVGFRFIGLGSIPLSESEATWALQAANLVHGGPTLVAAQPGYVLLTSIVFFVFGSGEFFARFWPALLGSVLVLAPFLYRERLGRTAAMILAVGIAIEPALVAASRQADGRMLAIVGFAFMVGFLLKRNAAGVGICGGLALFGGPTAWNAAIAIALGFAALRWSRPKSAPAQSGQNQLSARQVLPWAAGTIIAFGILLGFLPGGLSGLFGSLSSYMRGWTAGAQVEISLLLLAWTILSPLAFLLGCAGVLRGIFQQESRERGVTWLWAFLFVLAVAYPGRQTADLAYAAVPFLTLGAIQVERMRPPVALRLPTYSYAALIGVLSVSFWMSFSGFTSPAAGLGESPLRWGGILGVAFLVLASFILVSWGWAWKVARFGLIYGICGALLIYSLMTAWSGAGMNNRPEVEMWVNGTYPSEQKLAMKVLGDVSEWQTGDRNISTLVVNEVDSSSLRWALRNYREVTFVSQIPADAKPAIVIAVDKPNASLGLGVPYTGQALVWGQSVVWPALLPQDWIAWFFYRDLAYRPDVIARQSFILWLRSDLFPAAVKTGVNR